MPAPFGFSIGDFIAVATLIKDIASALQESGGARDDYQELERELELLELALSAVKSLTGPPQRQSEIMAIKLVALSCRHSLDVFYANIKKYNQNLSVTSRVSRMRASGKMLQWGLLMQSDIAKLRSYITTHVGNMNTLISAEILKTSQENAARANKQHDDLKESIEERWNETKTMILHVAKKAENSQQDIQEKLASTHSTVFQVGKSAQKSEILIKRNISVVEQVAEKLDREVAPNLGAVISTTSALQVGQNEMIKILEARLPQPDVRFTWAQAPVYLEDALGRTIIIPSEYDFDASHNANLMVEAVIAARFRKGPGMEKVHSGNYELFNSFDSTQVINASTFESIGLVPGMRLTMAIVIGQYGATTTIIRCARAGCKSQRFRIAEQGGQVCISCNTWFDRSSKKLCRPMRPNNFEGHHHNQFQASKIRSLNTSSDRKSYRNIKVYTTELPSTQALNKNRFGATLKMDSEYHPESDLFDNERTYTDVPQSWLRSMAKPLVMHTTHQFPLTAPDGTKPTVKAATRPSEVYASPERDYLALRGGISRAAEHEGPVSKATIAWSSQELKDVLASFATTYAIEKHRAGGTRQEDESSSNVPNNTSGAGEAEIDDRLSLPKIKTLGLTQITTLDVENLSAEEWAEVSLEGKIQFLSILGEGSGGSVTKCILRGGGKVFALKTLHLNFLADEPVLKKQLFRELEFNKRCESDWICRHYGCFSEPVAITVSIAMEYCEGGSLAGVYMEARKYEGIIGEKVFGKIAESVLRGLTYLHSLKIIHRDIKPPNILFTKEGQVKICDFGASGEFGTRGDMRTMIGTSLYMSPERMKGQSYTITSDVWSLGVTLLEAAQQRFPYFDPANPVAFAGLIDVTTLIITGPVPKLEDMEEKGVKWSEDFKHFIECCLEKEPFRRPTPWRMLEHPWMHTQIAKKVNMKRFLQMLWGWPKDTPEDQQTSSK